MTATYPWVVSVIRAVPGDGGSSRWLAVDLSFKELAATINNVSIGQHGYCYLMDERGNMVYHPQQQLLYAGLKKEEAGRLACLGDGTYVEDTVIYSVQRVPGSTWRVVGVSYIDETVNESFRQMVRITVITAGLVFLAALAAGWVLSRLLSRPLQQLETAMEQFEQDADHFAFQAVRGTREVQNLSDSFGHMVGRIQQLMTTVRERKLSCARQSSRRCRRRSTRIFSTIRWIPSPGCVSAAKMPMPSRWSMHWRGCSASASAAGMS